MLSRRYCKNRSFVVCLLVVVCLFVFFMLVLFGGQKSSEKSSSSGMEVIIRLKTIAGHCSIFASQLMKLKRLTVFCQSSNKTVSSEIGICSCRYLVLIFEQIGQVVVFASTCFFLA